MNLVTIRIESDAIMVAYGKVFSLPEDIFLFCDIQLFAELSTLKIPLFQYISALL